jgi:hypothetical protein
VVEADSSSSEVEGEEAAPQTPDNVTVKNSQCYFSYYPNQGCGFALFNQAFFLIADPDPGFLCGSGSSSRSRVLMTKNKKIYSWDFLYIFFLSDQKLQITYP